MVKMRVKDVSKEPIDFSDENQALVDTRGKTYSPDDEAWVYIDDSDPYSEINPSPRGTGEALSTSHLSVRRCGDRTDRRRIRYRPATD